jgi:undecaprenyl-diphosphatase
MSPLQSLFLGLVQGLTEFIPVSSTAHLILVPWLLGWTLDANTAFVFDVLLQLGTLVSAVVYFWRDLWNILRAVLGGLRRGQPFASTDARLGWLIVIGTLPAGIIGLTFKDFFEGLHEQPVIVAGILLAAAALLFVSDRLGQHTRNAASLTWLDAFIIGCAQALALLPGISRSAATISGALLRNMERPAAARFSFLLMIPAMLGANVVAVRDLMAIPHFTTYLPSLGMGFIAAAVVGYACIHWLLSYLARQSLRVFAWYRIGFGAFCLVAALLSMV